MHQSQLADLYITCVSGSSELIEKWTSYPTLETNKQQRSVPFPWYIPLFIGVFLVESVCFLTSPTTKTHDFENILKNIEGDFLKLSPRASSESKTPTSHHLHIFWGLEFSQQTTLSPQPTAQCSHGQSTYSAPWETWAPPKNRAISAFHSAMYPTWTGPSPKRWRDN